MEQEPVPEPEQEPEPIVLEFPHSVAGPADLLGDEVLSFGGTIRDAGHVVVQELGFPRGDRLGQSSEFGDLGLGGALVERHQLPAGRGE